MNYFPKRNISSGQKKTMWRKTWILVNLSESSSSKAHYESTTWRRTHLGIWPLMPNPRKAKNALQKYIRLPFEMHSTRFNNRQTSIVRLPAVTNLWACNRNIHSAFIKHSCSISLFLIICQISKLQVQKYSTSPFFHL